MPGHLRWQISRGRRDYGRARARFLVSDDVTDEQQVAELVAAITGCLGPVDVLVFNATGPQPEAPVTDVAWSDHVAQLSFFV
jgi:3-oxoacyl-[acyl-carrier protein] reductase